MLKWLILFPSEPCHYLCGFAKNAALHPPILPVIPKSGNSRLWAQGGYISPCTPCLALLSWNINPEGPDGRGHSYTYCGAMSLVTSLFLWCMCQAIRQEVNQELMGQESHREYGNVTGVSTHGLFGYLNCRRWKWWCWGSRRHNEIIMFESWGRCWCRKLARVCKYRQDATQAGVSIIFNDFKFVVT